MGLIEALFISLIRLVTAAIRSAVALLGFVLNRAAHVVIIPQ